MLLHSILSITKKTTITALLLAAICLAIPAMPCIANETRAGDRHKDAMQAAILYAQQGKYAQAIEQAKLAVSLNPQNVSYLFNLAELLATEGKKEEALSYYEKALKLNPNFAPAIVGKCNYLTESGNPLEALTVLENANKSNYQIQLQLAKTHFALGDMDKSEAAAKEILRSNASDYEAKLLLAQINFEKRNIPPAVILADELIKNDPTQSGAYILLSQCFVVTRSGLKNAVDIVQLAKAKAKDKGYVFSQLAQAFERCASAIRRSEPDASENRMIWRALAEECWKQAVNAEPTNAQLRYLYASELRKNRKFVEAYYQVCKSIELDPANKKALLLKDKLKNAKYDLLGWLRLKLTGGLQ